MALIGPNAVKNSCASRKVVRVALINIAAFATLTQAQPLYSIIEIAPTHDLDSTTGLGVNDKGIVVGSYFPFLSDDLPAIWVDGRLSLLELLPGQDYSSAKAVNLYAGVAGGNNDRGAYWEDGGVVDIGLLPGATVTSVSDINNAGRVVGYSGDHIDGDPTYHPITWQNGLLDDLGAPDGYEFVYGNALNEAGDIVGHMYLQGQLAYHAFLNTTGVWTDLGTLPGHVNSRAFEINDLGQIVGLSADAYFNGKEQAVLWEVGRVIQLPNSPDYMESEAWAINNLSLIVGTHRRHPTQGAQGVLWVDGEVYRLIDLIPPVSGWIELTPFDISDAGYITGGGTNDEFESRAFLMIPVEQPCEGDANGDKVVDPLDAGYVLARFDCPVNTGDAECDAADANADLVVDPLDVGYVLSRFGECE